MDAPCPPAGVKLGGGGGGRAYMYRYNYVNNKLVKQGGGEFPGNGISPGYVPVRHSYSVNHGVVKGITINVAIPVMQGSPTNTHMHAHAHTHTLYNAICIRLRIAMARW